MGFSIFVFSGTHGVWFERRYREDVAGLFSLIWKSLLSFLSFGCHHSTFASDASKVGGEGSVLAAEAARAGNEFKDSRGGGVFAVDHVSAQISGEVGGRDSGVM